jgi:hypothetical protein
MSTYVLIEKYTVGAGGASSVTLGSGGTIPQTYTDLVVKVSSRNTDSVYARQIRVTLNGNTSNLYSYRHVYSDSGTATSSTESSVASLFSAWSDGATATASTFGNAEITIPNYTSSNNKSFNIDYVMENNSTSVYLGLVAGLWSNTSAVTSVSFSTNSGNFAQYSTFYLYGILKA